MHPRNNVHLTIIVIFRLLMIAQPLCKRDERDKHFQWNTEFLIKVLDLLFHMQYERVYFLGAGVADRGKFREL